MLLRYFLVTLITFHYARIFFFVFVCEYNHNFVSKTYFCELQLMKSLFASLVKYCVSKVSAYKKKKY